MQTNLAPLESGLKAIAEPNRLELLRQLREPRTIDGVELTPSKLGQGPETRRLTREAVRHHLSVLADLGLVRIGRKRREDGRLVNEFRVEPRGLFKLLEDLRVLWAQTPQDETPLTEPLELGDPRTSALPPPPRIVLLHALHPGQGMGLRQADLRGARGWVIGASPRAQIPLGYDPYVAAEDAEIVPDNGGYRLIDLRGSRNRISLNDDVFGVGEERALKHGDVIRVGRSWMVFQTHGT